LGVSEEVAMRDGAGNKLSEEDAAMVKAVEVKPEGASLNRVSVDPKAGVKPDKEKGEKPEPPDSTTVPKF
jgi:hypothetical protein